MGKISTDKPVIPDHNFLFTFTMLAIGMSNRLVSDAAACWSEKGCDEMPPTLRNEAIDFMQGVIRRAFIMHCNQSIGSRYPGME